MSALLIVLFFIATAIAFYAVNRPLDPVSKNVVNIVLLIMMILALLRLAGVI
jgi:hypothetical protein